MTTAVQQHPCHARITCRSGSSRLRMLGTMLRRRVPVSTVSHPSVVRRVDPARVHAARCIVVRRRARRKGQSGRLDKRHEQQRHEQPTSLTSRRSRPGAKQQPQGCPCSFHCTAMSLGRCPRSDLSQVRTVRRANPANAGRDVEFHGPRRVAETPRQRLSSGDTLFDAGAGDCHGGGQPGHPYHSFVDRLARLPHGVPEAARAAQRRGATAADT